MIAPSSPPGPPPSPLPGPAVGFGSSHQGTPNGDGTFTSSPGDSALAIQPVVVLAFPASGPTQLLRGIYDDVAITGVGCASAWVGPQSVIAGSGVRVRPGDTVHVQAHDQSGLWAVPDPGGAVLELVVLR